MPLSEAVTNRLWVVGGIAVFAIVVILAALSSHEGEGPDGTLPHRGPVAEVQVSDAVLTVSNATPTGEQVELSWQRRYDVYSVTIDEVLYVVPDAGGSPLTAGGTVTVLSAERDEYEINPIEPARRVDVLVLNAPGDRWFAVAGVEVLESGEVSFHGEGARQWDERYRRLVAQVQADQIDLDPAFDGIENRNVAILAAWVKEWNNRRDAPIPIQEAWRASR